ncbi:MAG: MFS transporter, partial [Actinomycetia bacterium]|nr:MFS transporter [Actinomycetes bacterium]
MKGLYIVAAVTMAGVSSVFALLAEIEDRYDLATASLGWIAGSAFLSALITQLSFARYADRGHAELVLRAGIVASAVGLIWFAASTELWQFVAARSLLGAGVGMIIPPARRAIVVAADGNQGELLGTFYAAYLSGFVFGPPVAGALTELSDVRMPFLVLGLCTAASLVSVARLQIPAAQEPAAEVDKRVLRRLVRSRKVVAAILVVMSFRYSIGVFEPLWAPYLDDLGASTTLITLSLTGFALPMLVVARPAGRLSDRFGPRLTSVLSAAATVPLMAAYGQVGVIPVVMGMAVPHGLLEAIQSPGSQAAVADAAPHDDASAAQGLAEASGSLAAAIGAMTAAPLFDWLGPGPA